MHKFVDSKDEKLTDKAFSRMLLPSVLGILLCIVCLCSTTFAWFTDSAPSAQNEIKAADECLLSVTVTESGEELQNIESGVLLEAGKEYTVTLSLPSGSASGYCMIVAGGKTYYSDYIARHSRSEPKTVTFTLTVATDQTVVFKPHWGIYSKETDVADNKLLIP